jgi:NTP pyrophosphatase (non-canonical NTP hydrolase)
MEPKDDPLGLLLLKLRAFYQARDWDQFHSPKNLVMNLATEIGELVEPFRWITEQQSGQLDAKALQEVSDEIADVFTMVVYLSFKLGIDPIEASLQKLKKNAQKYPVEACQGKSCKYTSYIDIPSQTHL